MIGKLWSWWKFSQTLIIGLFCLASLFMTAISSQAAISFVQTNSATPQTSQSTVAVTFLSAQSTGNLNVVVVGWNDSKTSQLRHRQQRESVCFGGAWRCSERRRHPGDLLRQEY